MPVFWHFRVLFSLQTFLRPLIFDTLFRAEAKQVCNAISVTQFSQKCSCLSLFLVIVILLVLSSTIHEKVVIREEKRS